MGCRPAGVVRIFHRGLSRQKLTGYRDDREVVGVGRPRRVNVASPLYMVLVPSRTTSYMHGLVHVSATNKAWYVQTVRRLFLFLVYSCMYSADAALATVGAKVRSACAFQFPRWWWCLCCHVSLPLRLLIPFSSSGPNEDSVFLLMNGWKGLLVNQNQSKPRWKGLLCIHMGCR